MDPVTGDDGPLDPAGSPGLAGSAGSARAESTTPAARSVDAPLQAALLRAVGGDRKWWHPRPARLAGWRGTVPVVAAVGAVLLLSLLGIAAPWSDSTLPAQGGSSLAGSAAPAPPVPGGTSDAAGGTDLQPGATPTPAVPSHPPRPTTPCHPPLAVVASPDIAPLVRELAGSLASGRCPQVAVRAEQPSDTLATMAGGGTAPEVWVPGSTFWLQRATSGSGQDLPRSGTSIARSPVVVAIPQPVHDQIAGPNVLPVWIMVYHKTVSGEIPRMSMADPATTEGALALVSLRAALEQYSEGDEAATFLHTINFRNHLAGTAVDPDAMLARLAGTAPSQAGTRVGLFPTTEQAVHAYHRRSPATQILAMGTYDAFIDADYPVAVASTLDEHRAGLASELLAQLRSPAAVQRLVEAGFRPPDDAPVRPAVLDETTRFPDYPAPVALPSNAQWKSILDGWNWSA